MRNELIVKMTLKRTNSVHLIMYMYNSIIYVGIHACMYMSGTVYIMYINLITILLLSPLYCLLYYYNGSVYSADINMIH